MRAVVFDQPGPAATLRIEEVPMVEVGEGELLVRVRAAGVNRADILQRRGLYPPPAGASSILGLEFAGEVVHPVGRWKEGDRVMGVTTGGGYGEFLPIDPDVVLPIPSALDFASAAAVPEAFLTAFLNLFTLGNLKRGESVLIHAAASGIGTAAIQLAKRAGAHVLGTVRTAAKIEPCRAVGADRVYLSGTDTDRVAILKELDGRIDLVLDMLGAPFFDLNCSVLAREGRLVVIGFLGGSRGEMDMSQIIRKMLTIRGTSLRGTSLPKKAELVERFRADFLDDFESGQLRPVVDSIMPIDHVVAAHLRMEANESVGKIILTF